MVRVYCTEVGERGIWGGGEIEIEIEDGNDG